MLLSDLITKMGLTISVQEALIDINKGAVAFNGQISTVEIEVNPKVGDLVTYSGTRYAIRKRDLTKNLHVQRGFMLRIGNWFDARTFGMHYVLCEDKIKELYPYPGRPKDIIVAVEIHQVGGRFDGPE